MRLKLLSDRGKDLINQLVVPTIRMRRYMGQEKPRGDDMVIITVRDSIQTQK